MHGAEEKKSAGRTLAGGGIVAPVSPVPLEIVLSRMTPEELCEALALLRWCARLEKVDAARAGRLTHPILERPPFQRLAAARRRAQSGP